MQHEFAMAAAYVSGGLQGVSHGGIPQHMSQPFVTGELDHLSYIYDPSPGAFIDQCKGTSSVGCLKLLSQPLFAFFHLASSYMAHET